MNCNQKRSCINVDNNAVEWLNGCMNEWSFIINRQRLAAWFKVAI